MKSLSIIVPALNEADVIEATLGSLQRVRERGAEVVVVDGGSSDGTPVLCNGMADRVIGGPRGRARQMNTGAAEARGDVLLFLHADTLLPRQGAKAAAQAVTDGAVWGYFRVAIAGGSIWFPLIGGLMNLRSRLTRVATGDQALFVERDAFERIGGYPDQPLMEDVALCKALRAIAPPACLRLTVRTSGRRWERHGVLRTVLLMWRLRWMYWRGVPAEEIARAWR